MVAKTAGRKTTKTAATDTKAAEAGSSTDAISNPLYDELLVWADRNAEQLVNAYIDIDGKWLGSEIVATGLPASELSAMPPLPVKPAARELSVSWQEEIEVQTYKEDRHGHRSLVTLALGRVDLLIGCERPWLDQGYEKDGNTGCWEVDWHPYRDALLILCRPALSSVASTMRDFNRLKSRLEHDEDCRTERCVVLTATPKYRDIFENQGICYAYVKGDTLHP